MELRKECIGMQIKLKDLPLVTIENNKAKFPLYKNLGLDVFEAPKKRAKKDDKVD